MRAGIQLYTLRNLTESFTSTARRVADAGFAGVEFAGLPEEPNMVSRALDEAGLAVAGAHVGIDDLETDYEPTVGAYEHAGCDRFVVPSYPREAFESRDGVDECAERLAALADRLAADSHELHYHNHSFEFVDLDGEDAFERLLDRTPDAVRIEVDTGLARHGGVDPVELIDRCGHRVSLLHLTDTRPDSDETKHADLGQGVVDLEGCVDAAARNEVEWVIAEHGSTADPPATLVRAGGTLDRLLAK